MTFNSFLPSLQPGYRACGKPSKDAIHPVFLHFAYTELLDLFRSVDLRWWEKRTILITHGAVLFAYSPILFRTSSFFILLERKPAALTECIRFHYPWFGSIVTTADEGHVCAKSFIALLLIGANDFLLILWIFIVKKDLHTFCWSSGRYFDWGLFHQYLLRYCLLRTGQIYGVKSGR